MHTVTTVRTASCSFTTHLKSMGAESVTSADHLQGQLSRTLANLKAVVWNQSNTAALHEPGPYEGGTKGMRSA